MLDRIRPIIPVLSSIVVLVLLGVAAMNMQNNLLFWAFGMVFASLLLSVVLAIWMMRSIGFRRLDPKHGVVGEPLVIRYAVTNRSRFLPIFNLRIEEVSDRGCANWSRFVTSSPAWILHVAPGETVHGEAVVWPAARGEVRFDVLRISTTFPFGLFGRSRRRSQPTHTLIFPRVYMLRRGVLKAIVPSGPMGMRLSNRPGGGDDYFGLREYRPGDSRRQIAWKRSAGTGTLVITERTLPNPPRLRIVLDLTTPTEEITVPSDESGLKPRHLEERAISLAATIVEYAARHGYDVGLAVAGFDIPVTPLRSNHWHVEKIMGALASIDLDRERISFDDRQAVESERAGLVMIHPGRVRPGMMRGAGWHFSSLQLLHLIEYRAHQSMFAPDGQAPTQASITKREHDDQQRPAKASRRQEEAA